MVYLKNFKFDHETLYLIFSLIIPSIGMGATTVILPIYLDQVGFSVLEIGEVLSIQLVISGALMIPFGRLADKYNKKNFIIYARIISAVSWSAFLITTNFYVLYVITAFRGVGWAIGTGSYSALMADMTTEQTRNYAYSLNSFGNAISSTGGALLAVIPGMLSLEGVDVFNSYRPIFAIVVVINLISLLIVAAKVHPPKIDKKKEKLTLWPKKSRSVIMKFSVSSLVGLGAGIIVELFPLWFYLRFHITGSVLGPIYAVSNITLAIAFLAAPYLVEKVGNVNMIVITQAVSIVLLMLIPVIFSIWVVAILFIARSLLMNISGPIQGSFLMSIVSPDERASASSITGSIHTIPRAFGPAIGGYMMNNGDLVAPFYITSILYAISTITFYIFFMKYNKK